MRDFPDRPPASLTHLARERVAARAARDFARADALRAEIEAAGWKVVDRAGGTILERAAPPDVLEGPEPRYGAADRVPSRLAEPSAAAFSVLVVAGDDAPELARLLDALRRTAPAGTQAVVVVNGPSPEVESLLAAGSPDLAPIAGIPPEVVRTSAWLGHATTLNIGLRRASGEIVVLADPSTVPTGDALTPLGEALADPAVALAGPIGLRSSDLGRFEPSDAPEAAAIGLPWMAFRRSDAARLGPVDERFTVPRHLDEWWSLVLRAGLDGDEPRRAVRVELPLAWHEPGAGDAADADPERTRLEKRNAYRVLDAFRGRRDLTVG